MSVLRVFLMIFLIVGVTGCGSGGQDPMTRAVFDALRPTAPAAAEPLHRRQDQIRQAIAASHPSEPVLMVTLPSRDVVATFVRAGQNGAVTTWMDGGGVAVSLHGGVLVSTRGLGHDLMAADAGLAQANLQDAAAQYHRAFRFLSAEGVLETLPLTCTATRNGPFWREVCRAGAETVENSYTLSAGEMLRSRQWLGPALGYVELEMLEF